VIVCEPPADVLYVTAQLLLLPLGEASVQLAGVKLPPPEVVKLTVPLGAKAPAPEVSVTVAVHVVPPPCVTCAGEQLTLVLVPRETLKVCEFDSPPPGVGLKTVIANVPNDVTSLAGMAAVTCELLTSVVVRAEPANRTTEDELKFDPFTVSVNAPEPEATLVGEMLVVVGTGLLTVNDALFAAVRDMPLVAVAVNTTPVSALLYVTVLSVKLLVPFVIDPLVVPPRVPVPAFTLRLTVVADVTLLGLPFASCD
jgi:hypothetical protein